MDLGAWTQPKADAGRLGRLSFGYVIGAGMMAAVLSFITVAASAGASFEEDEDAVVVDLAPPEEPPPEPVVEEKPPEPEAPKPQPRRKLVAVTEVSDDKPAEKDPVPSAGQETDEPFGDEAPPPPEPPKPAVVEAPPPPPPPPKPKPVPRGPIQVTENVTPPTSISQAPPSYPADAKAQGIEGVVIVKYVVTETGAVTDVQIVRGPDALAQACLAAVRTWRFQPAVSEGRPVAVYRVARFPFRIKT